MKIAFEEHDLVAVEGLDPNVLEIEKNAGDGDDGMWITMGKKSELDAPVNEHVMINLSRNEAIVLANAILGMYFNQKPD